MTYPRAVRRLLPSLLPGLVLTLAAPWAPVVLASGAPAEARAAGKIQSDLTGWTGEQLADGRTAGTVVRRGRVFLKSPVTTTRVDGTTYDVLTDDDLMRRHRLELPFGFDPRTVAATLGLGD